MKKSLLFCLGLIGLVSLLPARELFVGPGGASGGDGSHANPWQELATAVGALQPGDTLTLLPGEYRPRQLKISVRGTPEQPIVIQGAQRDLSVITAWQEQDLRWEPVPSHRFVYQSACPVPVVWVTDVAGGMILQPAPALHDMDAFRGTWLYDAEAGKLFIHALDGACPPPAGIKTSVDSGYLLLLDKAEYLTLRNLSFYGSAHRDPRSSALGCAIRTLHTVGLRIEACNFLYNSGGVNITNACRDTIVRRCFFTRNESFGYSEMAQLFFGSGARGCLAEENLITQGRTHGLRFYSNAEDVTARGNIIVAERMGLYYKASKGKRLAERNVVLRCDSFNYSDLAGGRPITDTANTFANPSFIYDQNPTNLLFDELKDDPRFCAPEHFDFRLQSDSPFLGRGAFPEPAPVFYLAPDGDDEANGRSERTPRRTLARLLREPLDGVTIYLAPGTYGENVIMTENCRNLTLRGRGPDPAARLPEMQLRGSHGIRLENLHITRLELRQASDITLERLESETFVAADSQHVRLKRGTVDTLQWQRVRDSEIILSVLANPPDCRECTGLLTGYNAAQPCFGLGNQGQITGARDRQSSRVEPDISELSLIAAFPDSAAFSWTTPHISTDQWRVRDAWWITRPAVSFLEYGETPDCPQRIPSIGEIFHHVRVRGLKPATRYYYRASVPEKLMGLSLKGDVTLMREAMANQPWEGSRQTPVHSFTTPATPALTPQEIHVDPAAAADGDGRPEAPLRSLGAATARVRPGDTIILQPGLYHESFLPRLSGLPGHPITLRAARPGTAILDGSRYLRPGAVHLQNCDYMTIRGLVFQNFSNKNFASRAGMEYGQVQIIGSRHISLLDNVFSGFGVYQYLISVKTSSDILISNNVFADGVNSITGAYNGNLTITGNTFFVPQIYHFTFTSTLPGARVSVRKNLFVAQSRQKALSKVGRCGIDGEAAIDFDENAWYFPPDDPFRYCGMEGVQFPTDEMTSPGGLRRLRENTPFEKNGIELAHFAFRRTPFVDPMQENEYRQQVTEPFVSGSIIPTLEYFAVAEDLGYGAAPERCQP